MKNDIVNLTHYSPGTPYSDLGQQLAEVLACCQAALGYKLITWINADWSWHSFYWIQCKFNEIV